MVFRRFWHQPSKRPWSVRSDPYYELVGMVTVSWAFIETQLDYVNVIALRVDGGDQIKRELPVSLRPKISFFRQAHERLPQFASFRDEGLLIVEQINAQKEHRHDFVHSVIQSTKALNGARSLTRNVYLGDRLSSKDTHYTHDLGWEIHAKALKLARRTGDHALNVARAIVPEGFDP